VVARRPGARGRRRRPRPRPLEPRDGYGSVGAGPGDPDLITVRGRAALDAADVVVHDRLVHPDLLTGRVAVDVGEGARTPPGTPGGLSTPYWSPWPGRASEWSGLRAGTPSCSAGAPRRPRRWRRPGSGSRSFPAPTSAFGGVGLRRDPGHRPPLRVVDRRRDRAQRRRSGGGLGSRRHRNRHARGPHGPGPDRRHCRATGGRRPPSRHAGGGGVAGGPCPTSGWSGPPWPGFPPQWRRRTYRVRPSWSSATSCDCPDRIAWFGADAAVEEIINR